MSDKFDENAVEHEMYVHLVWSTKNQKPVLSSIAQYLYHYICDQVLSCECNVISARIFNDHIQLVVKFSPDISLSNLIITLKVATSLLIRTNFPEMKNFEWQKSDFAFSVGHDEACSIIDTKSDAKGFAEVISILLNNNGLEYNLQDVLE